MPSNHLILCRPLLLPPSIFPSTRVFSDESVLHIRWPKYWNFSFSISPSNEHSGLISRMDWLDLLAAQGTLKNLLQQHSSKASILWRSAFFIVQLSHPYMTTGKTIPLTRCLNCFNPATKDQVTFSWGREAGGTLGVCHHIRGVWSFGACVPTGGHALGAEGGFWRQCLWGRVSCRQSLDVSSPLPPSRWQPLSLLDCPVPPRRLQTEACSDERSSGSPHRSVTGAQRPPWAAPPFPVLEKAVDTGPPPARPPCLPFCSGWASGAAWSPHHGMRGRLQLPPRPEPGAVPVGLASGHPHGTACTLAITLL